MASSGQSSTGIQLAPIFVPGASKASVLKTKQKITAFGQWMDLSRAQPLQLYQNMGYDADAKKTLTQVLEDAALVKATRDRLAEETSKILALIAKVRSLSETAFSRETAAAAGVTANETRAAAHWLLSTLVREEPVQTACWLHDLGDALPPVLAEEIRVATAAAAAAAQVPVITPSQDERATALETALLSEKRGKEKYKSMCITLRDQADSLAADLDALRAQAQRSEEASKAQLISAMSIIKLLEADVADLELAKNKLEELVEADAESRRTDLATLQDENDRLRKANEELKGIKDDAADERLRQQLLELQLEVRQEGLRFEDLADKVKGLEADLQMREEQEQHLKAELEAAKEQSRTFQNQEQATRRDLNASHQQAIDDAREHNARVNELRAQAAAQNEDMMRHEESNRRNYMNLLARRRKTESLWREAEANFDQQREASALEKAELQAQVAQLQGQIVRRHDAWVVEKQDFQAHILELQGEIGQQRDAWAVEKEELQGQILLLAGQISQHRDAWAVEKEQLQGQVGQQRDAWAVEKEELQGQILLLQGQIGQQRDAWAVEKEQLQGQVGQQRDAWAVEREELQGQILLLQGQIGQQREASALEKAELQAQVTQLQGQVGQQRDAWAVEMEELQARVTLLEDQNHEQRDAWAVEKEELQAQNHEQREASASASLDHARCAWMAAADLLGIPEFRQGTFRPEIGQEMLSGREIASAGLPATFVAWALQRPWPPASAPGAATVSVPEQQPFGAALVALATSVTTMPLSWRDDYSDAWARLASVFRHVTADHSAAAPVEAWKIHLLDRLLAHILRDAATTFLLRLAASLTLRAMHLRWPGEVAAAAPSGIAGRGLGASDLHHALIAHVMQGVGLSDDASRHVGQMQDRLSGRMITLMCPGELGQDSPGMLVLDRQAEVLCWVHADHCRATFPVLSLTNPWGGPSWQLDLTGSPSMDWLAAFFFHCCI
ncbi:uncharacterized protein UV8b_05736 [Ustilaginoidea virens]|uniref:Uncharacterized protein n=1 Tax=Ustilaginoidea virens TaxID=1159556 RepID=A0A8E5HTZ7_USTVR|nr:uncharacterized protein UV8b_05736 [Ustilaginoidea virens]QUC21493.1 hypothetical protein UV8b_05736 [Ustilaginoidea virens]